jgi:cystathionine beta-lyase/cystathionine gamma-synthase
MLCTSLTKSFSGHGDVMAGSLVLNSASQRADQLRGLMLAMQLGGNLPPLYHEDAEVLECNSR